jgi:hypothetical protein
LVSNLDGKTGWWIILNDPAAGRNAEFADRWTAEVVAILYQDRRRESAPKLSGLALSKGGPRPPPADGLIPASEWPSPVQSYAQASPAALRAYIRDAAGALGLKLMAFRVPKLDGILAPIVSVEVGNKARFERWFDPLCLAGWLFPPLNFRPADGYAPSPYLGYFLTIADSSGHWLQSTAVAAYEEDTSPSPRAAAQARRLSGGKHGLSLCRHPPWQR